MIRERFKAARTKTSPKSMGGQARVKRGNNFRYLRKVGW